MTGEEWIDNFCREHGIAWGDLGKVEQFDLTRRIPCRIRCWRVGGPVDIEPGGVCPECGRPTGGRYDVISRGGDL